MRRNAKDIVITLAAAAAVTILGCGNGASRDARTEGSEAQAASVNTVQTRGELGEQAFDFTLKNLEGKDVRLSDFKGKIVILDFWATWCGPCKMELPHFRELYKQYKDKGVAIVGVALDQQGLKIVAPFVQKNQIEYVTLIGTPDVVGRYGDIRGIPTTFIINQKGKITNKFVGYRNKADFEAEIVKLLGAKS
jgi:peroxiredoxin